MLLILTSKIDRKNSELFGLKINNFDSGNMVKKNRIGRSDFFFYLIRGHG